MAYVDGELDASQRAEVEAALAADPDLAKRAREMRALGEALGGHYAPVLDEPVPQRLIDTARAPAVPPIAEIVDFEKMRRRLRGRWGFPQVAAIAASLAFGAWVGPALLSGDDDALVVADAHGFVARGALDEALTKRLAADAAHDKSIALGVSFKTADAYCRAFALEAGTAGYACREGGRWRVRMASEAEPFDTAPDYRMAASALPIPVLQAIEDVIEGEPLDADGETAAKRRGWKAP